jgi:prepilin-type N-terminal cleavage/methylation domain-containing protein
MIPHGRQRYPQRLPKCPRAGDRSPDAAFTLLELIVVVAIIGTVLVLTLPRIELPGRQGDLETVARYLIKSHRQLKAEAVSRQLRHTLHLDLDRQRIWVSNADMDEQQQVDAAEEGFALPRRVRLESLRLPNDREISAGAYAVQYFPDGHSFMVAIDLVEPGGRRLTLHMEPFLTAARVLDEDGTASPL